MKSFEGNRRNVEFFFFFASAHWRTVNAVCLLWTPLNDGMSNGQNRWNRPMKANVYSIWFNEWILPFIIGMGLDEERMFIPLFEIFISCTFFNMSAEQINPRHALILSSVSRIETAFVGDEKCESKLNCESIYILSLSLIIPFISDIRDGYNDL